jgi:hypothetical protein
MHLILRSVALPLLCWVALVNPACAADGTSPAPSATSSATPSSTRYVWANSLSLRAQADGKSAALTKIPYGAALNLSDAGDAPVPHSEVFGKYTAHGKNIAVMLDGAWRKVHWQDKDGWVFDGYLSRYPAPDASLYPTEQKQFKYATPHEILYANHILGTGKKIEWDKSEGTKVPGYQAMQKYFKSIQYSFDPNALAAEMTWLDMQWNGGASVDYFAGYNEGGQTHITLRNLPLTYNEAMLWEMIFHSINDTEHLVENNSLKHSLDVVPGKSFDFEANGDVSMSEAFSCANNTCDMSSDLGD